MGLLSNSICGLFEFAKFAKLSKVCRHMCDSTNISCKMSCSLKCNLKGHVSQAKQYLTTFSTSFDIFDSNNCNQLFYHSQLNAVDM